MNKDLRPMAAAQRQTQTTIFCIAPFNVPHIMPLYEHMARQEGAKVTCAVVKALPQARQDLGWPEISPTSPHLQLWRRRSDQWAYFRHLVAADVVVFPGFFHNRMLPFHHWLRRATGKPSVLWSEPFLDDPRTSRSPLSLAIRRLLLGPCNTPKMHLLTMGTGAEKDYQSLGCQHWQNRQFGYSVQPFVSPAEPPVLSSTGPVHLIYCGSLVDYKGVDVLLDALGRDHLKDLAWHLTLIGDGPERDALIARAKAAGIDERLTFRGSVPLQQTVNDYRAGEVLVLPSRFDGWGAVVNEGMEFGMAVIASDAVGSAGLLVDEGVSGFVFPSGNSDELANRLHQVISNSELRHGMQKSGQARIVRFQPAAAAERLTSLCQGLAGKGPVPEYAEGLCARLPLQAPDNR